MWYSSQLTTEIWNCSHCGCSKMIFFVHLAVRQLNWRSTSMKWCLFESWWRKMCSSIMTALWEFQQGERNSCLVESRCRCLFGWTTETGKICTICSGGNNNALFVQSDYTSVCLEEVLCPWLTHQILIKSVTCIIISLLTQPGPSANAVSFHIPLESVM